MQITSRTSILALAFLATAALAINSAKAETALKVPFNFTVGGQAMPAGQYILRYDQGFNSITMRSKGNGKVFTWLVGPGAVDPTGNLVDVKFDQLSDDTHVLRSIQYGSQTTSRLDKVDYSADKNDSHAGTGR